VAIFLNHVPPALKEPNVNPLDALIHPFKATSSLPNRAAISGKVLNTGLDYWNGLLDWNTLFFACFGWLN